MDCFFARFVGFGFALDSRFFGLHSGDVEQCGCWNFDYRLLFMGFIWE